MSQTHSLPLHVAKLQHSTSGWDLYVPLMHPEVIEIDTSFGSIKGRFKSAFDDKVLTEGNYKEVLTSLLTEETEHTRLSVSLRAAQDGFQHPELDLRFDAFLAESSGVHLGFVPALGVEAAADTQEALERRLVENIRLEFVRSERLGSARDLLATQWFKGAKMKEKDMSLRFFTPSEIRDLKQTKQLLPEAASKVGPAPAPTFELDDSIEELEEAVSGPNPSSVLVVGPSGVGKSALIRNFWAQRYEGPSSLWETSATRLISTLTDRKGWQQNLARLCTELREEGDLLYVRNLANLFEVGQYKGSPTSVAEALRSYVDRGDVVLITECTGTEAEQIEAQAPGYTNLFRRVRMQEPEDEKLRSIVFQRAEWSAQRNDAQIDREATDTLVQLQKRYAPYSGFPGKPIQDLVSIITRESARQGGTPEVSRERVLDHYTEATGFPRFMIDPDAPLARSQIETHFRSRIFGQEVATDTVIDLMAAVKTRLIRANKPIASLLFAGPTGVGKTEMAKVLASFMFDDREQIIRFDMSEYADRKSVLQLTGEGAVRETGLLTSEVRKNPFSVLLLDEVEKAHPLFADLLLQILDAGRLTDAQGQVADFCSMIIVMTSNIGTEEQPGDTMGFGRTQDRSQVLTDHFERAVEQHFRPELFNRIDRVVPFTPLTEEVITQIVQRELDHVRARSGLVRRDVNLTISDEAIATLRRQGHDPTYGARHLQRTIHDQLVAPLARKIISYGADVPLSVTVDAKSEKGLEVAVEGRQQGEGQSAETDLRRSASQITDWRRIAQRIEQGFLYSHLLMLQYHLQREKRKLVKRKKSRLARGRGISERMHKKIGEIEKELSAIAEIREQLQEVFEAFSDLEEHAAAQILNSDSALDSADEADFFLEELEERQVDLTRAVMDLYSFHKSADKQTCVVGIYGHPYALVRRLASFYREVAEEIGMTYTSYVVQRTEGDHYQAHRRSALKQDPEEADADYLGAEIELDEAPADLLFGDETGLHRWIDRDEALYVQVRATSFAEYDDAYRPTDVHRKHFFEDKSVQRKYSTELGHLRGSKENVWNPDDLEPLKKTIRLQFLLALFREATTGTSRVDLEDSLGAASLLEEELI